MQQDGARPDPQMVIVVGGDPDAEARLADLTGPSTTIIAADSGLDWALAAGIEVHHVVGDLDSVSPRALATAEARGVQVHRHPADKDATDLELALVLVQDLVAGASERPGLTASRPSLLVVGPGGGRFDHLIGDLLAVAGPRLRGIDVSARFGPADVTIVRGNETAVIAAEPGDVISLLPLHGRARGVTTDGLRWPLRDADLTPGTSRGISNEVVALPVTVTVGEGTVAVFRPGEGAATVETREGPYDPSPLDPDSIQEKHQT